ncbi:hypothetical protein [Kriegella aquimaris]|uniref:Uncharacterized protein n=1 Tax=Kriegella aquimaris TaxID=192904 RepID=A0A1G9IH68_9FLAO|nr:hypothetical protein [Kriegella aquimaris]SDL24517.1 hypothetical protein SAMN04488514_101138 [Kriegella aquimaris]
MTLQEAYNFFESLKTETTKKEELKVYEKFLHILNELKNREFSKEEIQSIETALENLSLKASPENRKKYFKKALSKFEKYLKDTFSLTPKGYYTNLSVSLGVLFGVVMGVLIGERFEKSLGISFGICIGLFIGAYIGRRMDAQAQTANKVL